MRTEINPISAGSTSFNEAYPTNGWPYNPHIMNASKAYALDELGLNNSFNIYGRFFGTCGKIGTIFYTTYTQKRTPDSPQNLTLKSGKNLT
jgi:hypothetical protein